MSPAGNVHINTLQDYFPRGQTQFDPSHHICINLQLGEGYCYKKGTKASTSLFYDPDLREHKAKQQNLMFNVSAQVVSFFPIT